MMTVSKAYNKLKQSGYIVTDRRNGTKIAAKLHRYRCLATAIA